ncbi:MAG: biotin/lipoate A/B protein ligase family protein [Leptolyngbyaceae bacterium]|nr:biotin/lipoate A/B protein ligase family protein [Leptolyngbyaceae bacterium]
MNKWRMNKWRLIPLMEASGSLNMAIDEWLLDQHRLAHMPSVLRFYTWRPSAISLGYHQSRWPDHWNHLTWNGQPIDLVRRPSGGRAVLHDGDLTYAVITSGLNGRRMEVYRTLCQFLIEGWRSLGTALHYGTKERDYHRNPNCFATPTVADLITESGIKLIGSAQLRRQHAILQHGSMQLQPNLDLYHHVFGLPSSPGISHELTEPPICRDIPKIIDALIEAGRSCFSAEFCVEPLDSDEWDAISLYRNR